MAEKLEVPHYVIKWPANHSDSNDVTGQYLTLDIERLRTYMTKISEAFTELLNANSSQSKPGAFNLNCEIVETMQLRIPQIDDYLLEAPLSAYKSSTTKVIDRRRHGKRRLLNSAGTIFRMTSDYKRAYMTAVCRHRPWWSEFRYNLVRPAIHYRSAVVAQMGDTKWAIPNVVPN